MIVLTFDTDYMWEEDLERFLELFPIPGRATFFLWKPFRGLRLGDHELAPHPFLSETKPWRETIEEFEKDCGRTARVIRPHSCAYSHMLGIHLAQKGYRAISQATYLGRADLAPYRHPWGLWELPIYYMDSMDFTMCWNWPRIEWRPFSRELICRAVESDALFLFDFHPLHIALNTPSYDLYQTVRPRILERKGSCFDLAFRGRGTRSFFEELLHAMTARGMVSVCCEDLLEGIV